MNRPTVLDMDLVVVPREATDEMAQAGNIARLNIAGGYGGDGSYSAMLSASPYPTAWDDVRRYVEGLERENAAAYELVGKSGLEPYIELKERAEAAEAHIAELEAEVERLKDELGDPDGVVAHADSITKLSEARIAELEKRLVDAERVIEPFAERAGKLDGIWKDHETQWSPEYGNTAITIGHLRATRAYMEGK